MTAEEDSTFAKLAADEPDVPEGSTPRVTPVVEVVGTNGAIHGSDIVIELPLAVRMPQHYERMVHEKKVSMVLLRSGEAVKNNGNEVNLAIGTAGFALSQGDRPTMEDRIGYGFRNVNVCFERLRMNYSFLSGFINLHYSINIF